ncbi:MAG: hypothetical protein F4X34_00500 [Chloroflexi bacterium]|nr:hypothetical protein [Chloroflexota bacterium]
MMSSYSSTNLSVYLPFPKAEVAFRIRVSSDEANDPSEFVLSVHKWVADEDVPTSFAIGYTTDERGQDALPFTVDVSPCLADWVRGYTRWLVRAGVRATHDSIKVTGTFDESATAEQVLLGVRDACDMIRQRFEFYEDSILL